MNYQADFIQNGKLLWSEVDAPRKRRVVAPQLAMFLDRPDLWGPLGKTKPRYTPPKEQLALNLQEGGDENGRH